MKRYSILITALLAVFAHSAASAETSADFEELKERADAALAELDEARRDEEATSPASQTDSETDMSTPAEQSHQQTAPPSGTWRNPASIQPHRAVETPTAPAPT